MISSEAFSFISGPGQIDAAVAHIYVLLNLILLKLAFTQFIIRALSGQEDADHLIQKRSGGFPKFPFISNILKCSECGSRNVQYEAEVPESDKISSKIVGGSTVPYGAYPWQVEIQIEKQRNSKIWEHHCGGALIGMNVVLTAGHCLQKLHKDQLRVILGKHTLSKQDKFQRVYTVVQVIIHPDFRKEGPHSNDIAAMKIRPVNNTEENNKCNVQIRTICLPEQTTRPSDTSEWCTVSGWGTHAHGSSNISGILRAVAVPLLKLETCRQAEIYGSTNYQTILDSMICAGTLEGGIDACAGDSGGPLACKINGKFVLYGIVSWGDGCAKPNRPGVYTRVSYFTQWIRQYL